MGKYMPFEIEKKWQELWERKEIYKVKEDLSKKKYYLLEMFPYPSGKIHMGHVRNYTIGDVIARYKMMHGFNVLHPMGWDAFGMPAENAAIASKTHPATWTYKNIETMKKQLIRMGFSYDWSREFATCDTIYYKWEQWLFLQMYKKGLVFRKKSFVNWCESCQTVLANEQVEGGLCWRCKNEVLQKELFQWFFRITRYTEELLEYCEKLSGWPERVITMQKNWIGKSEGAEIIFPLEKENGRIEVFTTRPDTVFGATFMSLAPENPLSRELSKGTSQEKEIAAFIEKSLKQDKSIRTAEDFEKEGVFTGSYCFNPATGLKIPVYVANFVMMEYGTGAVMAVPTHDQRDFEFAKKYGLNLKVVIKPKDKELVSDQMTEAYVDNGIMVNSEPFNGMENEKAMKAIVKYLEKKGLGRPSVSYRLRDWGISRQRYWGNPIPIIYCDECGIVPVHEEDLPVLLPKDVNVTVMGRSPLVDNSDFVTTTCPECKKSARRETDTMDTFVESSWYFARFTCPDHDTSPLNKNKVSYWLPVDQYVGGIEHAVLHLLYARFFTKVLRDLGIIEVDEPFINLLTQGMVCKESFSCPEHGWLHPEEVKEGRCTHCGKEIIIGRVEKMSKSVKNVVDPEFLIEKYGADTARIFCLFAAPPERDLEWSDKGVEGCFRFLNRLWRAIIENKEKFINIKTFDGGLPLSGNIKNLRRKTHLTIKKVTLDIEEHFHFNTAISSIMELLNMIYQFEISKINDNLILSVLKEAFEAIILLLYPMVPHICEELWDRLGNPSGIMNVPWPSYDDEIIKAEKVTIVIQINGKVRSRISVPLYAKEEEIKEAAFSDPKVKEWIKSKEVKKTILIPQKLLSIVVK